MNKFDSAERETLEARENGGPGNAAGSHGAFDRDADADARLSAKDLRLLQALALRESIPGWPWCPAPCLNVLTDN
jgi:hypothetical protein